MFLIVAEITFSILLAIPIIGLCSTRSPREYSKKEEPSEKSPPRNSSPLRSRRARPLEPEGMIPVTEGSEKNPDVGETIDGRSKKSQKRVERSQKMKGYVLDKDKSVRRLEDRSKYEGKTSARYKRTAGTDMNGSLKTAKSPHKGKKSKKSVREMKSDKSKSSKKEKKSVQEKLKLEKKKSSIRQKNKKIEVEEPDSKKEAQGESEVKKPKKFHKIRKPFNNLFKLKRKRARNDVQVAERNGTWA